MKVKFKVYGVTETCDVQFARYQENGNLAIQLICEDGAPYATMTTNTGLKLNDDLVAIKNYTEGEKYPSILMDCGIIETRLIDTISSGYAYIPVYELTDKAKKERDKQLAS